MNKGDANARRANIEVPPQPGSPEQAPRLLPLGAIGTSLLFGGIACVLATLAFVWLADEVLENEFAAFDSGIILWLYRFWGPATNQVMALLTALGDSVVLVLLLTIVGIALLAKGRWIDVGGLILAGAGGGILNYVLKNLYQRARPDLIQGPFHLSTYSFPSGHTMGAITCYGMLAFIAIRLLRQRHHKIAVGILTALLVLGIALSRVYFGVHFPTDVLGGLIAGGGWLVLVIVVVQAAEWHARRRQMTG